MSIPTWAGRLKKKADHLADTVGDAVAEATDDVGESVANLTRKGRKAAKRLARKASAKASDLGSVSQATAELSKRADAGSRRAKRAAAAKLAVTAAKAAAAAKKAEASALAAASAAEKTAGKKKKHRIRKVLLLGALTGGAVAVSKMLRPADPAVVDVEPAPTTPAATSAPEVTNTEAINTAATNTEAPATEATAAEQGTEATEQAQPLVATSTGRHALESDDDETAVSEFGPDSHPAREDGSEPDGFPIKGNADSMLYHVPGSRFYNATVAEVWFRSAEAAEAAGFLLPPSQRKDA